MLKVLITDGNGTLELPNPSQDTRDLLAFLSENNIILAVSSNELRNTIESRFRQASLSIPEIIVTREELGVSKPSPRYVQRIIQLTGAKQNEIIYLGDSDRTDIFCAINAGVLPFRADYSTAGTPCNYGISVQSPKALQDYISTYGMQQEPYFGWICSTPCKETNQNIDIRTLLFQQEEKYPILKKVLKENEDIQIGKGKTNVKNILFHYLLSQIYFSGLTSSIDTITVYPGHSPGSVNPTLEYFSDQLAKLFRDRFIRDLLIRYVEAPQSRFQGKNRNIGNQLGTIHLNPDRSHYIESKRILVIDDFTTADYSLETARRMLLQSGAQSVSGIAVAKFRTTHSLSRISNGWDPYAPFPLNDIQVTTLSTYGTSYPDADEYFHRTIWPFYANKMQQQF